MISASYLFTIMKNQEIFDINHHQSLITIQSIRETAGTHLDTFWFELISLINLNQQSRLIKYIDQSIILSG